MNDAILEAVFVKDAPDVQAKVDAFFAELDVLQAEMGFSHYLTIEEDLGERVLVKIIPASITLLGGTEAIEADRDASRIESSTANEVKARIGLGASKLKENRTAPCPHSAMRVAQMFRPRPRRPERETPRPPLRTGGI